VGAVGGALGAVGICGGVPIATELGREATGVGDLGGAEIGPEFFNN
jgi:hypothetical protein